MNIYITSDTHFGDDKVRRLSRSMFKTTDEHDEKILDNLEKLNTTEKDKLYFLGDLGVLKGEFLKRFKRIKGEKILLRGNHDRKEVSWYKEQGINNVIDYPFFYDHQVLFSHEPHPFNNQYILNVHGDLHGEIIDDDNYINVSVDVNFYKALDLNQLIKRKESLKKIRTKHFDRNWHHGKTRKFC